MMKILHKRIEVFISSGYFYISNSMQVPVKNTDALASLLTDHLPIAFSYCKNKSEQ